MYVCLQCSYNCTRTRISWPRCQRLGRHRVCVVNNYADILAKSKNVPLPFFPFLGAQVDLLTKKRRRKSCDTVPFKEPYKALAKDIRVKKKMLVFSKIECTIVAFFACHEKRYLCKLLHILATCDSFLNKK